MDNVVKKIIDFLSEAYALSKYIFNFLFMIVISWAISLVLPITTFQVGILLMMFWFLNLYYRVK